MLNFRGIGRAVYIGALVTLCACSSEDSKGAASPPGEPPGTGPQDPPPTTAVLKGVAASGGPLAKATILVCDQAGAKKTAMADEAGAYNVDVTGMTGPLLVAAIADDLELAALLTSFTLGTNTANVSPLTDKIASDVATSDLSLPGTLQLIAACSTAGVTIETVKSRAGELRATILDALKDSGVADPEAFDPVTTPMAADHTGVDAVLDAIVHNRNPPVDLAHPDLSATNLYDRNLQLIDSSNPLDVTLKAWSAYGRRIFIAGDSTASNYGKSVAPRMGWGQVFDRQLTDTAAVKVINAAQSGRSSRSFIHERWLRTIERNIAPGDYLLVQFGHNDEKCANETDVTFRCTYPGPTSDTTDAGFPPDMSFRASLEKYVTMARDKGAVPVLITPVTRIPRDSSVMTYVEGAFPITQTTHLGSSEATVNPKGDYSETVRDTAAANGVVMVDLDARSIAFMNEKGVGTGGPEATGGWRDYHLAVKDAATYPSYADPATVGHYLNADRTHFQEKGAEAIAGLVAQGLKEDMSGQVSGLVELLLGPRGVTLRGAW